MCGKLLITSSVKYDFHIRYRKGGGGDKRVREYIFKQSHLNICIILYIFLLFVPHEPSPIIMVHRGFL